jgi:hypothetical protein
MPTLLIFPVVSLALGVADGDHFFVGKVPYHPMT